MIKKFGLLICLMALNGCASVPGPSIGKINVYKSERRMDLVGMDGAIVRSYRIAMGGNPVGPKQYEGDMRTPEGLYMIETRNEHSKYHLSLKISYPNEQDILQAELMGLPPGGDIFIHGAPNQAGPVQSYMYRFKPAWTQGCIAVTNRNIEEIWRLVPDGTPIELFP